MTRGFNQNPFWDDRALRSKCGRVTPARHLACKRYIRGLRMSAGAKNQYLSHIEMTKAAVTRSHKPQKDRSIASINFGALCSAAGNARASRHPSAAATRPDGTAALRGTAATDPDTPAR
jgi:hypothetical protein